MRIRSARSAAPAAGRSAARWRVTLRYATLGFVALAFVAPVARGQETKPAPAPAPTGPTAPPTDSARRFTPPASIAELEARIKHLLDSTKTPGAGLAIVRNDSVLFAGGFGRARVEPELPATASTLFRIGSTSKAFVALTALQLQREGKLSLDDPIKKHLPELPYENPWEATDPIRIVHFLEHTSGFDDNSLRTYASNDPTPLTLEHGLALDTTTFVSRWRPGTRFSYSNPGPAIVARVIEKIEGKPFEQVVQERWFDRLGMRTATYLFPDTARLAMATLYRGDGRTPYPYWHVYIRPAGSINASALDMAQYVRFLLGRGTIGGTELLPAADLERMEHPETWIGRRAGLSVGYGLHMYSIPDTTGFVWSGHNGGVEGGLSDMRYLPEAHVGYALQINTANGAVLNEIGRQVRAYLTSGLPRPAEPPVGTVPASVAASFAGWYRPVSPRMQHLYFLERIMGLQRVAFTGDSMRITPWMGTGSTMVAVDSMRFRRPGESVATAALLRDAANQRPEALEVGGLGASFARVSTMVAGTEMGLAILWAITSLLAIVAGILGIIRALVRTVRRRNAEPSAARPLWRMASLSTLVLLLPIAMLVAVGPDIAQLGNPTMLSGLLYAGGLAFAAFAIAGLLMALRRREPTRGWVRLSLAAARVALVLNAVVAGYLAYWGYIGWQTWG